MGNDGITGLTALEERLSELDVSGLIRLTQHEPDLEYLFRHVLTQEAAYGSLLKQDRRKLHLMVGQALEREYANRLDEVAPILARHFDEAEDDARARDYFIRAADAAAARFANAEAAMHYRRALELARRGQVSGEQLTELNLKQGRVLEISGQYVEALSSYVEMEMVAQERADRRMLMEALMARATVHAAPTLLNDPAAGDDLAQRALAIALELNDRKSEAKVWWLRLMVSKFTGRLEEAISYGERSAAIARELNLREQLAYVLNDIFPNYLSAGQLPKAFAALNEAEQLWRELDNPNLLADTLTNVSELEFFTGHTDSAISKLNEAISLSEKTANPWGQSYERWMLGEVLLEQADYVGAITSFEDSIRLGAQAGFAFSQIATRGHLALIYAELGAYEQGVAMARKSIEIAMTLRPEWRGLGYAALALCQFNSGQVDEVESSLAMARQFTTFYDMSSLVTEIVQAEIGLAGGQHQAVAQSAAEAIKTIRAYGLVVYEPYALFYSGAALLKLGRLDEATAQLADAAALSSQLGTRRLLWRVQWAQATCEQQLGRHESADTFSAAAETEIASIAAALPPNLRASFRARVAEVKNANAAAGRVGT